MDAYLLLYTIQIWRDDAGLCHNASAGCPPRFRNDRFRTCRVCGAPDRYARWGRAGIFSRRHTNGCIDTVIYCSLDHG